MARRGKPHIPKPFVRPAVALTGSQDRTWQDIPVTDVLAGDIVVDYGLVTQVIAGEVTRITFKSGATLASVPPVPNVRAFHPVG